MTENFDPTDKLYTSTLTTRVELLDAVVDVLQSQPAKRALYPTIIEQLKRKVVFTMADHRRIAPHNNYRTVWEYRVINLIHFPEVHRGKIVEIPGGLRLAHPWEAGKLTKIKSPAIPWVWIIRGFVLGAIIGGMGIFIAVLILRGW